MGISSSGSECVCVAVSPSVCVLAHLIKNIHIHTLSHSSTLALFLSLARSLALTVLNLTRCSLVVAFQIYSFFCMYTHARSHSLSLSLYMSLSPSENHSFSSTMEIQSNFLLLLGCTMLCASECVYVLRVIFNIKTRRKLFLHIYFFHSIIYFQCRTL